MGNLEVLREAFAKRLATIPEESDGWAEGLGQLLEAESPAGGPKSRPKVEAPEDRLQPPYTNRELFLITKLASFYKEIQLWRLAAQKRFNRKISNKKNHINDDGMINQNGRFIPADGKAHHADYKPEAEK